MDLGIMWIFVGAIVVVFALTFLSQARAKRDAAKYRADYERSLQLQQEMVDCLREIRSAVQRLENQQSAANSTKGANDTSPRA